MRTGSGQSEPALALNERLENIFPSDLPFRGIVVRSDSAEQNIPRQITPLFVGKRWSCISLAELRNEYDGPFADVVAWLSTDAIRYFLPAFLRACIMDPPHVVGTLPESLVSRLHCDWKANPETWTVLTHAQRDAIIACLRNAVIGSKVCNRMLSDLC